LHKYTEVDISDQWILVLQGVHTLYIMRVHVHSCTSQYLNTEATYKAKDPNG